MIPNRFILAFLLASGVSLRAADTGGYLNIDGGYNYANDLSVEASGTEQTATGTFDLQSGFWVGVGQGFILNRFLALELETGFVYNPIDGENVAEFEAWYGHVPLMLSAVYRREFDNGLAPFIGIGGGGSVGIFNLDVTTEDLTIRETNVKVVPAGQAFAGLRYQFNDRISLGVIYKFFATTESNYDIRGLRFDFDPVRNHFIGLRLSVSY